MSKVKFSEGISLNADHCGLLALDEERLIHLIKKEPISNVYHVEQTPFARGKFATVRKCTERSTGREFAAKFIRRRRRAADQRQDALHEVAVLRLAASCTQIVRLHDVYETPAELALVLEMASGGELQTVLDEQDGIHEATAVLFMRQILEGLSFLHEHNIAHLDLKPQNLLLTGAFPDCEVKLCDFGISRVIQPGVEVREILGTPDYVAPEVLSYEPISLATDVWSVGVLAYVLLTGFSPFGGDNKQETFLNISQCSLTFPEDLFGGTSASARDFIRAALQVEPRKRMSARQCLQHPWLDATHVALIGFPPLPETPAIEPILTDSPELHEVPREAGDALLECRDEDCCKDYRDHRDGDVREVESDEDLPLKRPKKCCCCLPFPVSSCCDIRVSDVSIHGSKESSLVS